MSLSRRTTLGPLATAGVAMVVLLPYATGAQELAPGAQRIIATLRYQACTERVCYPPAVRTTELEIPVLPRALTP